MAYAVNFDYSYKKNTSANKEKTDADFADRFQKEILDCRIDKNIDETIRLFLGGNYNVDSSYANALHTKYKLSYCSPDSDTNSQLAKLIDAINTQNTLYWELVSWEHKRWNAYMITRGYRAPIGSEFDLICKGKANKTESYSENKFIHICICDDTITQDTLKPTSRLWNSSTKYDSIKLNEIERISLDYHKKRYSYINQENITSQINSLQQYVFDLKNVKKINTAITADAILDGYIGACNALLADDYSAWIMYNESFSTAKSIIAGDTYLTQSDRMRIYSIIYDIDNSLQDLKEINKRENYLDYDKALINNIPNYLLSLYNDLTVISFACHYSTDIVIVPWLLRAKNVVFYFSTIADAKSSEDSIKKFFKTHGNNTIPSFRVLDPNDTNKIQNIIAELNDVHNAIINITENTSDFIIYELGKNINIPIVSFDQTNGIKSFNARTIPKMTYDSIVTVNDNISLLPGGKLLSDTFAKTDMPYNKCRALENIFWKCAAVTRNDDKISNLWTGEIKRTIQRSKEEKSTSNVIKRIERPLHSNTQEFLKLLCDRQIITNYRHNVQNGTVSYTITDNNFYEYLTQKDGNLFEMLVYYKMLYSDFFNDVIPNVSFEWGERNVHNEIDVVATKGAIPVLISCKTSANINKNYIYEISCEAKMFNAIPILAVSQDLSSRDNNILVGNSAEVERSVSSNVAIIDSHILKDEHLLLKALEQIISGRYKGPEDFK